MLRLYDWKKSTEYRLSESKPQTKRNRFVQWPKKAEDDDQRTCQQHCIKLSQSGPNLIRNTASLMMDWEFGMTWPRLPRIGWQTDGITRKTGDERASSRRAAVVSASDKLRGPGPRTGRRIQFSFRRFNTVYEMRTDG